MKIILITILSLLTYSIFGQYDTIRCVDEVVDTVLYVHTKNSSLVALSVNNQNEGNTADPTDGYIAYGQLFEAPDSVTLKGYCFYGFVYSGSADTLVAKVYKTSVAGDIDSLIDSTLVPVPLMQNYSGDLYSDTIQLCVDFATPLKIKGNYVIALENNSPSDMYLVRTTDGQQEDLAYTYYYWGNNHNYDGWYQTYSDFGSLWDFDVLVEPIVIYNVSAEFVVTSDTKCFGDTLQIVSSSLTVDDTLLYNRMYNPDYSSYSPVSGFAYNYGDTVVADTFHVYANPGSYNAYFIGATNFSGWTFSDYNIMCPYNATAYQIDISLGGDTSLCHDSLVLSPGQYFDSYLWSTSDTTDLITVYADSLNVGVNEISVMTVFSGCESFDTILISANELSVDLGSDTTLCLNQELTLFTGVDGMHMWSSGQLTDTIVVGTFNTADSLYYSVEVESDNGCVGSDTILVVVENCLGVEENKALDFSIYPNPANENVTIDINGKAILKITDMSGRIVLQSRQIVDKQIIDISSLESGSYMVLIDEGNKVYQQKLQIIK